MKYIKRKTKIKMHTIIPQTCHTISNLGDT